MAISSGRISNTNITDLISRDFITATDRTKDTPPNFSNATFKPIALTSKLASKIGKNNIFEKNIPSDADRSLITIGIYPDSDNPSCAGKPDKAKIGPDNRKLSKYNKGSTKCRLNNPLDPTLIANNAIRDFEKGMPEHMIKSLENSIGDQVHDLAKKTKNTLGLDKNNAIIKGVNVVKKGLSEIGFPLSEKVNIKQLLSCPNSNGLSPGDLDALVNIGLSILFNSNFCISPEKVIDSVIDLATEGDVKKGNILKGMVEGLNGIGDKKAEDKVKILAATAAGLGGLTASDASKTKGLSKKVLDSLANNKPSKKAPAEEHQNMMSALETLDPDWSKDESGNVNVGAAKNNNYISELSKKKLQTRSKHANEISNVVDDEDDLDFISKAIIAANNSQPVKGDNSIPIPGFS